MLKASIIWIVTLMLSVTAACADEVRVYAAGAVQKAVEALIPTFEASTGHKITAIYDTVGALAGRVAAGEKPAVLIVSSSALRRLVQESALPQTTAIASVGRTGIGLAAAKDKPVPDISTPEKLKAALLAAPSIVHADPARGATAGTHFAKVLRDLGIADEIKTKVSVVPFGGAIAGEVAAGKYALGASQASEIVPNPKVAFVGFLPEPHQLWTEYAAAPVAVSPAAQQFLDALASANGRAAFAKIGFQR